MRRFLTIAMTLSIAVVVALPLTAQQTTTSRTITVRSANAAPIQATQDVQNNLETLRDRLKERFEHRFDDADEDDDGYLSKDEFEKLSTPSRQVSLRLQQQSDSRDASASASVKSQTTTQKPRELTEEQKKERKERLKAQFDEMDKDEDGSLSKDEFVNAQVGAMSHTLESQGNVQSQSVRASGASRSTSTMSTPARAPVNRPATP